MSVLNQGELPYCTDGVELKAFFRVSAKDIRLAAKDSAFDRNSYGFSIVSDLRYIKHDLICQLTSVRYFRFKILAALEGLEPLTPSLRRFTPRT
jgi:hypothetical protein